MRRDIVCEFQNLLPKPVIISIRDELQISEDIDGEVDRAARNFGFYAVLAEKADTRYQRLKFSFEVWQAEAEKRIATERQIEGHKKPLTESQMKAAVRSEPKYAAYQEKLLELDEQRRILKVIAKAFELKKDLVQSKSANRRNEMKGAR